MPWSPDQPKPESLDSVRQTWPPWGRDQVLWVVRRTVKGIGGRETTDFEYAVGVFRWPGERQGEDIITLRIRFEDGTETEQTGGWEFAPDGIRCRAKPWADGATG